MIFRFSDKHLKYRFIQNSVSQWQVFICLTVMLGFARNNDAATSNVKIRWIFIPVHILYFTLLVLGASKDALGTCEERVYPKIFTYQYGLFFLTYIGFLVLHKKEYLMDWHESIRDIDLEDSDSHAMLPDDTRRRLNVRILLKTQS